MASCPIVGDIAYGAVTTVMENMWANSANAYSVAINALDDLGRFDLDPITVGTQFTPNNAWWTVLRPRAPLEPVLVFDPNLDLVPPPPSGDVGPMPNFARAPTFDETAPVVPTRVGPGPLTVTPPVGPPALDAVVVPDAPVLDLPAFPELRDIVLPPPPDIVLPTFQGVRPDFAIAVPENTFGFDAQHYASPMLDKIRQRLTVMIDGKPGLPDAAARAMRDRAYAAIDVQGLRAEQEAIEQFAARGFSEPDGVLRAALAQARQNNQNQRNALARDVYLKDVDTAIEDMRFAVAQCIALEGTLMANFLGVQQLALDAAKTAIQVAIDIANARIALANLELEAFKTDAAVFRDLIQAALAELDIYKARLEGLRLIGELNQQDVAIYSERVKTVLSLVEIYKAQVDGAKAKADVNMARTQAFVAQVQAYGTRVDAYKTEWDAFGKQLEADLTQYKRYELGVQVYGNRTKIWSDTNSNLIEQHRLKLSDKELDITAYRAQLERMSTVLSAETQRLDALVRVYSANIDKYRADASIEAVVSEATARPFQLGIEQETQRVQTDLKNAELRIAQVTKLTEIMVGIKQSIAQVGAQLAAGLASSMSVGARIDSGTSTSTGCSTEFKYDMTK